MSEKINQYDVVFSEYFGPGIGKKENGKYCLYSDYELALKRAEAAEANHQSCTNELVEAVLKIDELKLKLAAKDKPKVDCVCCNGHGVVYEDEHSNDGGCAWVPVECPDCLGAGEIEEVK